MIKKLILIFLTTTLTLGACNAGSPSAPTVDVNAINTAALATAMAQISAQQTQTALVAPTNTTLPTDTPGSAATSGPATAAGPLPTGNAGALPTVSFNTTPNTNITPLAGFTQVAGSPVAPAGTAAPLGDACNNSSFVSDVTVPDNSVLEPGINFEKVWAIQNTGTCTWDEGYALVYIGGSSPNLDPRDYKFGKSGDEDFVAAGETANIGIELTTPCTPGKYEGTWRMRSDKGFYFGTVVSVYVEVKNKCK